MHRQLLAQIAERARIGARIRAPPSRRSCRARARACCAYRRQRRPAHREPRRAAQHHVFADRRDQVGQLFLDRAPGAGIRHLQQRLERCHRRPAQARPTLRTKLWNASLRATKSVSELTSTRAPAGPRRRQGRAPQRRPAPRQPPARPFWPRPPAPSCAASRPPPRYRRRCRRALACNPSCRRRSCRAAP